LNRLPERFSSRFLTRRAKLQEFLSSSRSFRKGKRGQRGNLKNNARRVFSRENFAGKFI
jgi:hypothetical protein